MAEENVNIRVDDPDWGRAGSEVDTEEDTDPTDPGQGSVPFDPNPPITPVGTTNDTNNARNTLNTSSDERDTDEHIISERKEVLKKWVGVDIDGNAGEASKELLIQSLVSRNKKNIPDGGMMYKGVKVLVHESGITRLSKNRTERNKRIINEFDELSKRAIAENLRRTRGDPTTSQEVGDDITSRINSVINDRIEERCG